MTESPPLFVYGTLMRGEPNHSMLATATFLRKAHTPPHFRLVSLGPYPALLKGGSCSVVGELFHVSEALRGELDAFEGHPDEYRRETITLLDGTSADAYILAFEPSKDAAPLIASGDWRAARDQP